jgi:hypothetical protein
MINLVLQEHHRILLLQNNLDFPQDLLLTAPFLHVQEKRNRKVHLSRFKTYNEENTKT